MTTMTKRMAPFCGTIALLAQVFVFQGCGGSNSGTTGTGGSSATGTGGDTASTGGTTGTGGTSTSTGGTTGTGGSGTGGTTATGGAGGAATTGFGQPACGNTAAGTAIAKGVTCTATDTALCYKTCGPEKAGVKSETCPAGGGTYAEMSGCSFDPSKDYSCYKVPATPDATCPTTVIQSGAACTIPDCVVCGGTTGYLDSGMNMKTGYCVCQAGASMPTWSCASSTAWPCPTGLGC